VQLINTQLLIDGGLWQHSTERKFHRENLKNLCSSPNLLGR
jgi:hypothetical protein